MKAKKVLDLIYEGKKLLLKNSIRNKINKDIDNLISPGHKTRYFREIPLKNINTILNKYGVTLVQEDNTEWSGFLSGSDSNAIFNIASIQSKNEEDMYTPFDDCVLSLSWYKMSSGRFEITCYLS